MAIGCGVEWLNIAAVPVVQCPADRRRALRMLPASQDEKTGFPQRPRETRVMNGVFKGLESPGAEGLPRAQACAPASLK